MRTPPLPLEPAVRDPRKLRRTALILVVIMITSAVGILYSYFKWAEKEANNETPAFKGRIEKNFKVWRQDESEGDFAAMDGEVYVIAPVVFSDPAGWKTTRAVLERLAKRYADRKDFHIVSMTIDPEGESPAKLKGYAEELGATLPQWWLCGAREESVHKFLKNNLKMEIYPHRKDGKWIYDGSLVLIDRDRHIRQATRKSSKVKRDAVVFNFEQAAAWDAEGRTAGLEEGKTNVQTLEDMLVKAVDHVLSKPVTQQ